MKRTELGESTGNGEIYAQTGVWTSTESREEEGSTGKPRRPLRRCAAIPEDGDGLVGGALGGVVLLLALLAALLLGGVGLRVLGESHGHGGGEEGEAEHQSHQFLHCGCFSPCYLDDLNRLSGL